MTLTRPTVVDLHAGDVLGIVANTLSVAPAAGQAVVFPAMRYAVVAGGRLTVLRDVGRIQFVGARQQGTILWPRVCSQRQLVG